MLSRQDWFFRSNCFFEIPYTVFNLENWQAICIIFFTNEPYGVVEGTTNENYHNWHSLNSHYINPRGCSSHYIHNGQQKHFNRRCLHDITILFVPSTDSVLNRNFLSRQDDVLQLCDHRLWVQPVWACAVQFFRNFF